MNRTISLLGSTGSIGMQTLSVADKLNLSVAAITADRNIKRLEEQIRKYKPVIASVFNEKAALDLKARVSDTNTKILSGSMGLIEAARIAAADSVVTAIAGSDGLLPTLAAIDEGRRVCIANKESLVCAGELVMKKAKESGAEIVPVDSEHSAIFQCMDRNRDSRLKRLILTASGGPFLNFGQPEMQNITPDMAVKHPRWSMGRKVSLDSATLMNKGFELIEAMHLFSVKPENITVLIHPESIIHSMVEFQDNSVIAQLSAPDMRLPIQYALTYPERRESDVSSLDFAKLAMLTFKEPDYNVFPCLKLALEAAKTGTLACASLSGADDAATELFLSGKIKFSDIYTLCSAAVVRADYRKNAQLDDIIAVIEDARRFVYDVAERLERKAY